MSKLAAVALVSAMGGGLFGAALTRTFGAAPQAPQIDIQTSQAVANLLQQVNTLERRVSLLSSLAKIRD